MPLQGPYLDLPLSPDDGAQATLILEFQDLGNGAAGTATSFTGPAPTFTRATAAAAKLSTGLWKLDVAAGVARYSYNGATTAVSTTGGGYFPEFSGTQLALNPRDMTQAAWVAVNVTPTQVATGITGVANSATRLTSAAIGGSILQTLVAAASSRTYSVWLRRVTGTGTITISQGATTLDVTASLNSLTYTRVELNASVLNSAFGITFGASGDVIDADCNQFEAGAFASSPIPSSGTRNADVLTYQTTGWYNATVSTILTNGAFQQASVPAAATQNQGLWLLDDGTARSEIDRFIASANLAYRGQGINADTGITIGAASFKVAAALTLNDVAIASAGTVVYTNGVATAIPAVTTFRVGISNTSNSAQLFGTISIIAYWPLRLLNATLNSITGANGLNFRAAVASKSGDDKPTMVKPMGLLVRPKKPRKRTLEPVVIPDLKSLRTPDVIPPQVEKEKIALSEFVSEEEDAVAQASLAAVLEQKRLQEEFIIAVIVQAISENRQASAAQRQAEIQQAAAMLQEIGADVQSVAQAVQHLLQQREKLKQRSAEIQAERQAEEEEKAAEEAKAQASAAKEEKSASMFQRGITALQDAIKGMTQPSSKSITMTMPDGRKVSAEVKNK